MKNANIEAWHFHAGLYGPEITWKVRNYFRAMSRSNVGAELVARLLNDKRSLFKSLLATRNKEEILSDDEQFTSAIVNDGRHPRANAVASGVNKFFNRVRFYEFLHICKFKKKALWACYVMSAFLFFEPI